MTEEPQNKQPPGRSCRSVYYCVHEEEIMSQWAAQRFFMNFNTKKILSQSQQKAFITFMFSGFLHLQSESYVPQKSWTERTIGFLLSYSSSPSPRTQKRHKINTHLIRGERNSWLSQNDVRNGQKMNGAKVFGSKSSNETKTQVSG